jgi:membrane-bound lytic murein transglycosylase A
LRRTSSGDHDTSILDGSLAIVRNGFFDRVVSCFSDTNFVPLGTPVFLSTTMPSSNTALNRLVFAQDTGTAIRGAARTDFYWGFGAAAGELAGRMKQNGQMWVLWPKQAGVPSAR